MMFDLTSTIELLERTPVSIYHLLNGVSEKWTSKNEGDGTWSPFDVIGHLILCEQTNWIPRLEILLSDTENKTFEVIDMTAQFTNSAGKTMNQLLHEFSALRKLNIQKLKNLNLKESDFSKKAMHPKYGEVTLSQLVATWLAHDLDHISQISRVMAKQYKTEVGPWINYLKILRQ
jgi:hypothetical protein